MSSPMKYYLRKGHNEKNPVTVDGQAFRFEPVSFFAGQWWALFATADPEEIELLDRAVGSQGVTEITAKDAETYLKKKHGSAPNVSKFTNSVLGHVPTPGEEDAARSVAASSERLKSPAEAPRQESSTESIGVDSDSNTVNSGATSGAERSVEDLITPQTIEPKANEGPFATSQKDLAAALGMTLDKLKSDFLKADGFPAKTDAGYDINAAKAFVNQS